MFRLLHFIPIALATAVGLMPSWSMADDAGADYFEKQIRPLLAKHCYRCHSERSKDPEAGLLLDSRMGWIEGGQTGASIIPGDPDASLLIRAVRYSDPELQMPPIKPLSVDEVAKLEHWVRIGAPGPIGIDLVPTEEPSDPSLGKSHWAFRPLRIDSPSMHPSNEWSGSSIDRLIAERLEKAGLHPVDDADPRDLLKRLYFQLIGLPPSPEEIQAFIDDTSSDALERTVDRLLASPRFGERWGRHWLDLARYADSNGLDENFLFREAWRYRNWVIARVNHDMPYDRFLLEQIAGDLLDYDSIEQRDQQRIAAGFLVIGPKVLLGNNERNQRMEVADEQMDTLGRAILGQTLGCARCHDHKFDPIPTADYYALAGIFASTRVMESRYMLGQQRLMERLVGLGSRGDIADDAYEAYWRGHPDLKEKKKRADAVLEVLRQDHCEELDALLQENAAGLAESVRDTRKSLDERISAQEAFIKTLAASLNSPPPIPPRAMIPADVDVPSDENIRLAGQFDRLGEVVPRGSLRVLMDDAPMEISSTESGRTALARWLTDESGRASQLVARVQANRVWYHLMGVGLVRTVDNFGRTGEQPSHPELLDYLAGQLIDSGWSVKALVRQIVLSRTFTLSSDFNQANDAIDPENRLLWRAHRRRLDPESFRDAMLTAAGQLDLTPMDSSVSYLGDQATAVGANKVRRRTDFPCRSIYLPVIRNDLPELFNVFDFADPHTTTGARSKTIVPTQGLFVLNDAMVMDASEATARRILAIAPKNDTDAKIDLMFERILNARPSNVETQAMRSFLIRTEESLCSENANEPEVRALAIACHALFASSRFQFLE